jgi:uncharacterized membrane protein
MCKDGHSNVAWFLVILPFVLLAVGIGLLMMHQNDGKGKKEEEKKKGCQAKQPF